MKNKKFLVALVWTITAWSGMLRAQNVVTDWNAIASTTIVKNGGKPSGAGSVWFSYTAIAAYDGVNAIDRQFQPF